MLFFMNVPALELLAQKGIIDLRKKGRYYQKINEDFYRYVLQKAAVNEADLQVFEAMMDKGIPWNIAVCFTRMVEELVRFRIGYP